MKIAVAGYGVEGETNYAYWSKDPSNEVTILDEQTVPSHPVPDGAELISGHRAFENLFNYDLVIRTAGLAPHKIATARKIWSATNEFFSNCPAPIIGVTGSKGKGTTASFIAEMLRAAGRNVWLVGNIGQPALEVLADISAEDIVVYELSSFQLWDIEASPETAVVLFIEQEHLDVHASMEEYVEAKAQITRYQTADNLLIYNADNQYASDIAAGSAATKIGYPSDETAHVEEGAFYYGQQYICDTDTIKLKGAHNIDNAIAAIDAAWRYTQDVAAIEAGLANFHGLPHRLAYVATVEGVEYYDDSIATTPGSAISALKAFPDQPKVIILGGSYKGSDFSELAAELQWHDVQVLLIGDEAARIAGVLSDTGFDRYEIISETANASSMETVVRRGHELAMDGSVVLLSPAAASFGLFKNYVDRGEQFTTAVKTL